MDTNTYAPDPKLLHLAEQMRLKAQLFYTAAMPYQTWTPVVIGERKKGVVVVESTGFHPDIRDLWYNEIEDKLKRQKVVRYVLGAEVWHGGAADPNRQERFVIAGADKLNNRICIAYDLQRDSLGRPRITGTPDIISMREALVGDLYTLLGARSSDVAVEA
jgi:hypothetical protein